MAALPDQLEEPLTPIEFRRLAKLSRLPVAWTASVRRRRLLLLGLAAPGFLAVFSTPLHQSLALFVAGLVSFAAALIFRSRSERVFVRAEAAAVWPPAAVPSPASLEIFDA